MVGANLVGGGNVVVLVADMAGRRKRGIGLVVAPQYLPCLRGRTAIDKFLLRWRVGGGEGR